MLVPAAISAPSLAETPTRRLSPLTTSSAARIEAAATGSAVPVMCPAVPSASLKPSRTIPARSPVVTMKATPGRHTAGSPPRFRKRSPSRTATAMPLMRFCVSGADGSSPERPATPVLSPRASHRPVKASVTDRTMPGSQVPHRRRPLTRARPRTTAASRATRPRLRRRPARAVRARPPSPRPRCPRGEPRQSAARPSCRAR